VRVCECGGGGRRGDRQVNIPFETGVGGVGRRTRRSEGVDSPVDIVKLPLSLPHTTTTRHQPLPLRIPTIAFPPLVFVFTFTK